LEGFVSPTAQSESTHSPVPDFGNAGLGIFRIISTNRRRAMTGPGPGELEPERLAIERERLRTERQKLAVEFRLKRRELTAGQTKGWKELLANPLTLAVVGGFITLMTTIVSNSFNVRANLASETSRAELARSAAKQTLQADLIKKFVESPKTATVRENLRFLVEAGLLPDYGEKIDAYLKANPEAAPKVGEAPRQERIEFETSSSLLSNSRTTIEGHINAFRSYLQSLGYQPPATTFKFRVDPDDPYNAYYDGKEMVFGPKLLDMPDIIYREYMQRVLAATNYNYWNSANWKVASLGSGLGDYLPCSFLGNPKFGEQYANAFRDTLKAAGIKTEGTLRDLKNTRSFVADSASAIEQEQHHAGEVWSGALWDARTILGCKEDVAKCEKLDRVILSTWSAVDLDQPDATLRFVEILIDQVRNTASPDLANEIRAMFERRGLKLEHH